MKQDKKNEKSNELFEALHMAIDELISVGPGNILIFLSGEREIIEVRDYLNSLDDVTFYVLALFSALSEQEQKIIFLKKNFENGGKRRIILATNIAETSLTVPGVRYVIDSGYAKLKRYSYKSKVEKLCIEKISKASADQRAGRCGRTGSGICIRLYSESDFDRRQAFTDPEILRSSLAGVILKMKTLGIGDPFEFPLIDKPKLRAFNDGFQQLFELGALTTENGNFSLLTDIGKKLSRLPLDPCIGRMILAARKENCLREILIIAAFLSLPDPRERPIENLAKAKEAHKVFVSKKSDFVTLLNLWYWCESKKLELKSNRSWQIVCSRQFLSFKKIREWWELHRQLKILIGNFGWSCNNLSANYDQCHRAILTGLLSHIGVKSSDGDFYFGKKNIKFFPLPGSIFFKKLPTWVMCAELSETSRLYGKMMAVIEPKWLENLAVHLIKRIRTNPKWDKTRRHVVAFEQATLYGLTIYKGRQVPFGQKECERSEARKILIQDALILGEIGDDLNFIVENKAFLDASEYVSHRYRQSIVLLDSETLFAFYDEHLPKDIIDYVSLRTWYDAEKRKSPKLLGLSQFFALPDIHAVEFKRLFPKYFTFSENKFCLHYYFDLHSQEDGVTVEIPLFLLNEVDEKCFEWLVPGMLSAKVAALIKSLPARTKKYFSPLWFYVKSFSKKFLNILDDDRQKENLNLGLFDALIRDAKASLNLDISKEDFDLSRVEKHHFMNFHILDNKNTLIVSGRDLKIIKNNLERSAIKAFHQVVSNAITSGYQNFSLFPCLKKGAVDVNLVKNSTFSSEVLTSLSCDFKNVLDKRFTTWAFRDLPEKMVIETIFGKIQSYPALSIDDNAVILKMFSSPKLANFSHYLGCRQLFFWKFLPIMNNLEKKFPQWKKIFFLYAYIPMATQKALMESLLMKVIERLFLHQPVPRKEEDFSHRLKVFSGNISKSMEHLLNEIEPILIAYTNLCAQLIPKKMNNLIYQDLKEQIANLIGANFIEATPDDVIPHLSRYLKAIEYRIVKFSTNAQRDIELFSQLAPVLDIQKIILRNNSLLSRPDCQRFRWIVEELRVSLFAQNLGTVMPVSVKRVLKMAEDLKLMI